MSLGRVVLAMSGGVDSSVAAQILVEQGYEVIGLFMRTGVHEHEDDSNPLKIAKTRGCCSAIDAGDAQRVADRLNIPFYALNFENDFARIKDYFADEYERGRTPNPCVVCNTWLKFGKLWEHACSLDADYIATGHYAQIRPSLAGAELHRAADPTKDQSYFLFGLEPAVLEKVLFPIGGFQKSEIREIAKATNLGVHSKPDSQEICFVPTGNYQDFLRVHRPNDDQARGEIVDTAGKVVGTHAGISRFTIGQRKGLGVAFGEPRYVVKLDADDNRVVIGPRELLEQSELEVERVNWLMKTPPTSAIQAEVKIRYLHEASPAELLPIAETPGRWKITFRSPQSAITPGQAAVFYQGSRVLGGGWIA